MNKKARLVITTQCPLSCIGCCMENWVFDPAKETEVEDLLKYDEIFITGGEPMLHPDELLNLIDRLRTKTNKLFIYTAHPYPESSFLKVLSKLDGCSITLHRNKDVDKFIEHRYNVRDFEGKSMRLNVFPKRQFHVNDSWNTRQKVWIKDCPLPEGEDFLKLKNLFKK